MKLKVFIEPIKIIKPSSLRFFVICIEMTAAVDAPKPGF